MTNDRPDADATEPIRIQGFHSVKHAWRFDVELVDLVAIDRAKAITMARDLAPDLVDPLTGAREVDEGEFSRLIGGDHPTGVGALGIRPPSPGTDRLLARAAAPIVFLEDPRRLGNVGAAIRTTAGLGGSGVLTSGTVDPWHERAVRASAGLHFAIAVHHVHRLPELGPRLVVFDADGIDLRDIAIPDDAVLAFGTERDGVSDELRERAGTVARIPMRPGVSSLNLATAVSIGLYAWLAGTDRSREEAVSAHPIPGSSPRIPEEESS